MNGAFSFWCLLVEGRHFSAAPAYTLNRCLPERAWEAERLKGESKDPKNFSISILIQGILTDLQSRQSISLLASLRPIKGQFVMEGFQTPYSQQISRAGFITACAVESERLIICRSTSSIRVGTGKEIVPMPP